MTQTSPPLIPPFYLKLCRLCLCALVPIIAPFLSNFKGHLLHIFFSISTIRNWQGPPRQTGWYKLGRGILQHWLLGFFAPHRHRDIQKTYHWFWHTTGFDTPAPANQLFLRFLVPIPLHNSNTRHGWKTYSKLLQIEIHSIRYWIDPFQWSSLLSLEEIVLGNT